MNPAPPKMKWFHIRNQIPIYISNKRASTMFQPMAPLAETPRASSSCCSALSRFSALLSTSSGRPPETSSRKPRRVSGLCLPSQGCRQVSQGWGL